MNCKRDNDLLEDIRDHQGYSPLAVAMRGDVISYPYLSFSPLVDKSFDYDREKYTLVHDYVTGKFNVILSFYKENEEEAFKGFYWQSDDLLNFTSVPRPFDPQPEPEYTMTDPENHGHTVTREIKDDTFTLVVKSEETGEETQRFSLERMNKKDLHGLDYKVDYDTARVNYEKFVLMVQCQPLNKQDGCLDCLTFIECRVGADGQIYSRFVEGLEELLSPREEGKFIQEIGHDVAYDFSEQEVTKKDQEDKAILPACCLLDMVFKKSEKNRNQWPRKIFIYGFRSVVDDYAHDDVTFTINLEKQISFVETRNIEDGIQEVPFTFAEDKEELHLQILLDQSRFCLLVHGVHEGLGGDGLKFDYCTIKSLLSKRWAIKASDYVSADIQIRIPKEFPDCS